MMMCQYFMTFDSDGRKSVNSHCCYTDLNTSLLWNCKKMNLLCFNTMLLQLLENGHCLENRHKFVAETSSSLVIFIVLLLQFTF